MKIRNNFVANSSTASFVVLYRTKDKELLSKKNKALLKELRFRFTSIINPSIYQKYYFCGEIKGVNESLIKIIDKLNPKEKEQRRNKREKIDNNTDKSKVLSLSSFYTKEEKEDSIALASNITVNEIIVMEFLYLNKIPFISSIDYDTKIFVYILDTVIIVDTIIQDAKAYDIEEMIDAIYNDRIISAPVREGKTLLKAGIEKLKSIYSVEVHKAKEYFTKGYYGEILKGKTHRDLKEEVMKILN